MQVSNEEYRVAMALRSKGYTHAIQLECCQDGETYEDHGEPLYVKSADEVGPLLRSFPEFTKTRVKWSCAIDKLTT